MEKKYDKNEYLVMDDEGMNLQSLPELGDGFDRQTEEIVDKAIRLFGLEEEAGA